MKRGRHIHLEGWLHMRIYQAVFAANGALGNILTLQRLDYLRVLVRVGSRPEQHESRIYGWRILRSFARGIGNQGHLAIRANGEARPVLDTAYGAVHGQRSLLQAAPPAVTRPIGMESPFTYPLAPVAFH